MANVCRLYGSQQGLPQRRLPPTQHRPTSWRCSRQQGPQFFRRILRIQPNPNSHNRHEQDHLSGHLIAKLHHGIHHLLVCHPQLLPCHPYISPRVASPVKGKLGAPIVSIKMWTSRLPHHYFEEPILKVFEGLSKCIKYIYPWLTYERQSGC